jgi:drug/metabolite transporter (DMT)-like permease
MDAATGDPENNEPPARRPLLGIALKLSSVVVFVAMGAFIKLAGVLPAGQVVFYRSFFATVPILIFLAWRRQLSHAIRTTRPASHFVRGLVGVAGMYLGFFALIRLPLPELTTLNYAQPLIVVVFSAIFLGEVVRAYRWSAVVVGLIGVIILAWPKLTLFTGAQAMDNAQALGVASALAGAAVGAVATLLIRNLVLTEPSATIVMWFSTICALFGLASYPFGWAELTPVQATYLVASGLCGGVAQILMTETYRHADVSTAAPFDYSSIIFASIAGYFLFGDLPTIHMIVGGSIVVSAGIFIIWREHQLGLPRAAVRKVTPPPQ